MSVALTIEWNASVDRVLRFSTWNRRKSVRYMIKIFGKLRYHWQPELSITITYWCLSIAPIFISLALLYENTKISRSSFILFIIFIVLVWIGETMFCVIFYCLSLSLATKCIICMDNDNLNMFESLSLSLNALSTSSSGQY